MIKKYDSKGKAANAARMKSRNKEGKKYEAYCIGTDEDNEIKWGLREVGTNEPVLEGDAPEQPKKKGRRSFIKADLLTQLPENVKDDNYQYRYMNSKKPGRIYGLIQKGWEIAKEEDKQMREMYGTASQETGRNMEAGYSPDGSLILMRLPKELKEVRDAELREENERQLRSNALDGIEEDKMYGKIEKVKVG